MENRIAELRVAKGMTQDQLAERVGVHVSNVNRIENGKAFPPLTTFAKYARALEVDLADLFRRPLDRSRVEIAGFIGSGAIVEPSFEQASPDGLYQIDLPFPLPGEMVGFQVRGTSNMPRYDDGDVVIVYREQRRPLFSFFGEEAAVRLRDGRRYLKTIMRHGDTVSLFSWNDKPIENVDIEWIGEIHSTLRAPQIKRSSRDFDRRESSPQ